MTGSQLPTAPATTSGGCRKEERTAADAGLAAAIVKLLITAGARQAVVIFPEASSVATPSSPSTYSVKTISPEGRQNREEADAFIPGVRFCAGPPAAGTVQMSPPVDPSSLISPWISAIRDPSGDQRGQAIWSGGFQSDRVPLPSAFTLYSWAVQ